MGCRASSPEARESRQESRRIGRELARDAAADAAVAKLLLLGSGDSGKSTVLKQVKILHSGGFSREELAAAAPAVRQNALASMRALLDSVEDDEDGGFDLADSAVHCRLVQDYADGGDRVALADSLGCLWRDRRVRECYERRRHLLQVQDSAAYFFDHLERIFASNYVPSR